MVVVTGGLGKEMESKRKDSRSRDFKSTRGVFIVLDLRSVVKETAREESRWGRLSWDT